MPVTTINLGGNSVQLVTIPAAPGFRTVKIVPSNVVAVVKSIFSGQTQAQRWPGAEGWKGTFSLPQMRQDQADVWIAAILQLQGMANAFQLGDPLKRIPRGTVYGIPSVDNTFAMPAGSSTLYSYGWGPGQVAAFKAGDYLQVGYRLHRVMDDVAVDGNGKAAIPVWPSLRETPAGLIVTQNAKGLFRLAVNDVGWDVDYTKLTSMSFDVVEYR